MEKLLETLEKETNILIEWFKVNEIKSNSDKCHLIIVNNQDNNIKIGNDIITSKTSVKLLGVTIDNKLNLMNMCIIYAKKPIISYMHLLE